MSKVRTVAAIGVVAGVAVVYGVSIGTAEAVFDGVSNDYIDDIDGLSDKQKKFLKVASGVGSHLVTGATSATIGYSVGKLISKTILKA